MKRILAIALLVVMSSVSLADQGGSFFLSDLKEILAQQKALWEQLEGAFDMYSAGDAGRIGWAENHELDGTRIGPYRLYAKPKGRSGPFIYQIEIETTKSFYDKSALPAPLAKAASVKEEITAIKIIPLAAKDYFSPTPD